MHISQIGFSIDNLNSAVDEKTVDVNYFDGLRIYNYSKRTNLKGPWNNVTRTCRGLILDSNDNIVARPFQKFFNYRSGLGPSFSEDEPIYAYEKFDGSMGLIYFNPNQNRFMVSTRGNINSEQAVIGTDLLSQMNYVPPEGVTVMVEIIHPFTSIVINYHGDKKLVLLGGIKIDTGEFIPPHSEEFSNWKGEISPVKRFNSLSECIAEHEKVTEDPTKEGWVIYSGDYSRRAKMKRDAYMQLHKFVSQISTTTIWEALSGNYLDRSIELAPEFLKTTLIIEATRQQGIFRDRKTSALTALRDVMASLPNPHTKKDFALAVKALAPKKLHGMIFPAYESGKILDADCWKSIYPKFERLGIEETIKNKEERRSRFQNIKTFQDLFDVFGKDEPDCALSEGEAAEADENE